MWIKHISTVKFNLWNYGILTFAWLPVTILPIDFYMLVHFVHFRKKLSLITSSKLFILQNISENFIYRDF